MDRILFSADFLQKMKALISKYKKEMLALFEEEINRQKQIGAHQALDLTITTVNTAPIPTESNTQQTKELCGSLLNLTTAASAERSNNDDNSNNNFEIVADEAVSNEHATVDPNENAVKTLSLPVTYDDNHEILNIRKEITSYSETTCALPTLENLASAQLETESAKQSNLTPVHQQKEVNSEVETRSQLSQQFVSSANLPTCVSVKEKPFDSDSIETTFLTSALGNSEREEVSLLDVPDDEMLTHNINEVIAPTDYNSNQYAIDNAPTTSTTSRTVVDVPMFKMFKSEFDKFTNMFYREKIETNFLVEKDQTDENESQSEIENSEENLNILDKKQKLAFEPDASKSLEAESENSADKNTQNDQQLLSLSQLCEPVSTNVIGTNPTSVFKGIIPRQNSQTLLQQQSSPVPIVDQNTTESIAQPPNEQSKQTTKNPRKRQQPPLTDHSPSLSNKKFSKSKKILKDQVLKHQKSFSAVSKSSKSSEEFTTKKSLKTKKQTKATSPPTKKLKTKLSKLVLSPSLNTTTEVSIEPATPKTAFSASNTQVASTKSFSQIGKIKKLSTSVTPKPATFDMTLPTHESLSEVRRNSTFSDICNADQNDEDINPNCVVIDNEVGEKEDNNNTGNWYWESSNKYNDIKVISLKCHLKDCKLMFNKMKQHKEHMLDAHNRRPYSCQVCSSTHVNKNMWDMHISASHPNGPWICRICSKKSQNEYSLYGHYVFYHEQGKFSCIRCNFEADLRAEVSTHISNQHPEMSRNKRPNLKQFEQNRNLCRSYSSEGAKNEVDLQKRNITCAASTTATTLNTNDKIWTYWTKCLLCSEPQKNLQVLREHWATKHSIQYFPCYVRGCTDSFAKSSLCNNHVKERHLLNRDAKLDCAFCTETFGDHDELRDHTMNYHQEGKFSCSKCEKCVENTRQAVVKHFDSEHSKLLQEQNEKMMIRTESLHCPARCGEMIFYDSYDQDQSKALLFQHLESEHQQKLFPCTYNYCHHSFDLTTELEDHVQTKHSHVKMWSCSYCHYFDRRHKDLSQHIFNCHYPGEFFCAYQNCQEKPKRFRQLVYDHYNKTHLKKENQSKTANLLADKLGTLLEKPYWQQKQPQV